MVTEPKAGEITYGALHAAEFSVDLRGHQIAIAGQNIRSQDLAKERTAAGRNCDRLGAHGPAIMLLAAQPDGACNGAIVVDDQFERRTMI
nr:hypothetical protein [Bradyrhizobium cosmicum]